MQKTLNKTLHIHGNCLHTLTSGLVKIHPAPVNHGITFKTDDGMIISSHLYTKPANLCTTISNGNVTIVTPEHLMAAFSMMNITNAHVELIGIHEVPLLDGSAKTWVDLFSNNILEQDVKQKTIKILREVKIKFGDAYAIVKPYDGYKATLKIHFNNTLIDSTNTVVSITDPMDVYDARTFYCLESDDDIPQVDGYMTDHIGSSIIVKPNGTLHNSYMRKPNEFAEHKMLDLIGDMYINAMPMEGEVIVYKSGHTMNGMLMKAILSDPNNFEII